MPLEQRSSLALLADIGGTHARFAMARGDDIGPIVTLQTAQYGGAEAAIRAFLETDQLSSPPQTAALACAGPIEDRRVQLTNSDWRIDADRICSELGFEDVILVNDFASLAWAVPFLKESDLHPVGDGKSVDGAPSVVLGPGTGLGVAGYLPRGGEDAVIVGEGGHVSMPSVTDREAEVMTAARNELGHVSAERLLSGEGLVRLYETLARLDGLEAPERSAAEITEAAAAQACSLCRAAFDMFCQLLGTVASDLALTFGARGGVYIAGGIVPKTKGRLRRLTVPPAFRGQGAVPDLPRPDPDFDRDASRAGIFGLDARAARDRVAIIGHSVPGTSDLRLVSGPANWHRRPLIHNLDADGLQSDRHIHQCFLISVIANGGLYGPNKPSNSPVLLRCYVLALLLSFVTMVSLTNSQSVADEATIQSLRYHLAPSNSARGKQLFVNKGCVICHSVNNAGGDVGPPLDVDPSTQTIDVFGFAARMWKGAEEMVALQVMEVGFPIELNGQELAHLAHFLHDYDAQMTFSDEDIPAIVRKLMEAEKRKKPDL